MFLFDLAVFSNNVTFFTEINIVPNSVPLHRYNVFWARTLGDEWLLLSSLCAGAGRSDSIQFLVRFAFVVRVRRKQGVQPNDYWSSSTLHHVVLQHKNLLKQKTVADRRRE